TKLAKFNDTGYDNIVLDEMFFCSVRNLARIKRYCESNPDKIVVATGDTDQLECIDCITNQNNYDENYNKCVDMIFPAGMFLNENKRLKSKKDKDTLKRFKQDIFDESIPVSQTIGKYFRTAKDNKVQPGKQELHLQHGQRGGGSEAAQEEPALGSRGDASVHNMVQSEEAILQRELRIR
ncbi:MAG: hypothetical protein ACKPKO_52170, partial [Candidatus Fonsibacter sp.]